MASRTAAVSLSRLERWMQEVVVHPGHDPEHAVECAAAKVGLSPEVGRALVLPSKTLTAAERIGIYQGMYPMRMFDALAADYPYVLHLVGQERFEELVEEYSLAHPSRSFTFNRFGERFPEFLAETPGIQKRALAIELARLELALTVAFDADESPVLTDAEVKSFPEERWEGAQLTTVASFQVLELAYPVGDYIDAVKAEKRPPELARKASFVAVYRRNFAVYRLDLARPEYVLLKALHEQTPLGQALMETGSRFRGRVRPEQLFKSFRDWRSQGIFSGVR